jgi:large subunit ribosomal protein L35
MPRAKPAEKLENLLVWGRACRYIFRILFPKIEGTSSVPGLQEVVVATIRLVGERHYVMKAKNHSGAKKRLQLLSSGKVKRKQVGMRHLLSPHKSKTKRHLGDTVYVHSANMNQTRRLLNF